MPDRRNNPDHLDDRVLRELSTELDALAERDRSEPDPGFESRVTRGTRPAVAGSIRPAPGRAGAWWALAGAACVLVAFGGLWLARPGPGPGDDASVTLAEFEREIEEFLFVEQLPGELTDLPENGEFEPAEELLLEVFGEEGGVS
jgi:hypothetical protein